MLRTISFLFSLLCVAVGAVLAQITIHQNDFASPGSAFTENSVDSVTVDLGLAGPNRTWTIPDEAWIQDLELWVDPLGTQYADSFPTATHCGTDPEYSGFNYFRLAGNGFFGLGSVDPNGGPQMYSVYQSEGTFIPLPLTYQTGWTFRVQWTTEYQPGYTVVVVDSVPCIVDAWGTINTPFGSWPVLRVQQHRFEAAYFQGTPVYSSEEYDYVWLGQNPPIRVEIRSYYGGPDPNFTVGRIRVIGPQANSAPDRGPVASIFAVEQNYPNPFNPTTILPIEMARASHVTLSVYDETGRLVSTQEMELSAGSHQLPIDGSNWATGTYFAQVRQGTQTLIQKMQLIK